MPEHYNDKALIKGDMPKIITIYNHKDSIAKTAFGYNLVAKLAKGGKKVLVTESLDDDRDE